MLHDLGSLVVIPARGRERVEFTLFDPRNTAQRAGRGAVNHGPLDPVKTP